jgi:hypothetical protein
VSGRAVTKKYCLDHARPDDFMHVQYKWFLFILERKGTLKRFGGDGWQWYFIPIHLSSLIACKLMALVLVFNLQTTLSSPWQLQRASL